MTAACTRHRRAGRRSATVAAIAVASSVALAPTAHADDAPPRVVQVYDCTAEFRTPFDLAAYQGQPGTRLILSIYGTAHPIECVVMSDGFRYFQQVDVMGIPHTLPELPNVRPDYWTSINFYPL